MSGRGEKIARELYKVRRRAHVLREEFGPEADQREEVREADGVVRMLEGIRRAWLKEYRREREEGGG